MSRFLVIAFPMSALLSVKRAFALKGCGDTRAKHIWMVNQKAPLNEKIHVLLKFGDRLIKPDLG